MSLQTFVFIKSQIFKVFITIALIIIKANFSSACTIFILTDGISVYFCNNEDFSNPITKIWFQPEGDGFYGCVYVGFDNGWAQGGLNTEGLSFDWVAGYQEKWERKADFKSARMNPSERMLESCSSIDEAIDFYKTYWEPVFSYAKILIADKTGTSVIIGAKDGNLNIDRAEKSWGFGYGSQALGMMLQEPVQSTVENGFKILNACHQEGKYATKYSNIFDLKNGDIFLHRIEAWHEYVELNLKTELEKGAHYYDIPQIQKQSVEEPKPLQNNMKRFLLDQYRPIRDTEPEITDKIRTFNLDLYKGKLNRDYLTSEIWNELAPKINEFGEEQTKELGEFISLILVNKELRNSGQTEYRYRMEFIKATILQCYIVDKYAKITDTYSEDAIFKE